MQRKLFREKAPVDGLGNLRVESAVQHFAGQKHNRAVLPLEYRDQRNVFAAGALLDPRFEVGRQNPRGVQPAVAELFPRAPFVGDLLDAEHRVSGQQPVRDPPIHFRQLPFLLFRDQTDPQNTALPAASEPQKEPEQRQEQAEEQKTLLSEEALYKQELPAKYLSHACLLPARQSAASRRNSSAKSKSHAPCQRSASTELPAVRFCR